jgi:hypothetical protein
VVRRVTVEPVGDDADESEDAEELADSSTLYVLPAGKAPIAAVFLRAPDQWWMVARWDLQSGDLERGAWLRGTIYPRRSDLSADGSILCYLLTKRSNRPFMGMTGRQMFTGVSKLPWVFTLAAWPEPSGTSGYHFVDPPRWEIGEPGHGDAEPLRARHGLALNEQVQYAVERRRGWVEDVKSPPRIAGDDWDEDRSAILTKPRPGGDGSMRLVLQDRGWDPEAPGAIDGRAPEYRLERGGRAVVLDDVLWADWHPTGLLLVATEDSRLQIREPELDRAVILREHDLSTLRPTPGPSPEWAQRW